MSDDTPVVICWPVAKLADPKPGSYKTRCAWCQREVWFAPTSEWVLQKGGFALCMYCGLQALQAKEALVKGWARDHGAQAN